MFLAIDEPTRPQPTIRSFMGLAYSIAGVAERVRPLGCAGFRYRAAVVTGTSPVRIGLLGYGTVGSAVHRLLRDAAKSIERVTGQPVAVASALVRDPARHEGTREGVLTTAFT